MEAHWSAAWVGLPWRRDGRTIDGCDCWGLVVLVYRDVWAIDLPPYHGAIDATEAAIARGAAEGPWRRIDLSVAREGDLVTMRAGRGGGHVGIVAGDGLMLHMVEARSSRLDRWTRGPWGLSLTGLWRHGGMATS